MSHIRWEVDVWGWLPKNIFIWIIILKDIRVFIQVKAIFYDVSHILIPKWFGRVVKKVDIQRFFSGECEKMCVTRP